MTTEHTRQIPQRSNLTELQLLYWVGQKLRPSAPLFNNIFAFTFSSPLQPIAFQQAFASVVCRSDALRTIIQEEGGIPQRYILGSLPSQLEYLDFSIGVQPAQMWRSWQQQHATTPLRLGHSLYESALVKLATSQFIWFLNQHHLITDATSIFLVYQEVMQAYGRIIAGKAPITEPLPPFEAFVTAKGKFRHSRRYAKAMAFWEQKLAGEIEPLRFFGRSAHKHTHIVHRLTYNLGVERTQRLQKLANREEISAATAELSQFNVMAALLLAHLHRLSGNHRLGFVTTIHNRPTRPLRHTIGVLMELCPLLVSIDEGETFLSLIQKVTAEMKQTLLHYRYGSGIVWQQYNLDVMFNFAWRPALVFEGQPVQQSIIHSGSGSEHFALHVHHLADTDSYELYFDFHADLFTADEQAFAVRAFVELVDALLQDDGQRLPWPVATCQSPAMKGNGRSPTTLLPTYIAPRNVTEQQLQPIWQDVLGIEQIGIHENFFDLGGNSWQAMRLLVNIEAVTGQYLPLAAMLSANTIAEMAARLQDEKAETSTNVITIQAGNPEERPLFFIPGAAGNTLVIARIAAHLSRRQPVYTFHMPGLVNQQQRLTRLEEMATYYIELIRSIKSTGPYRLTGYSAGGIIALEIARQLQADGEQIDFLGIIDMPALNAPLKRWRSLTSRIGVMLGRNETQIDDLFLFGRDWLNRLHFFIKLGYRQMAWQQWRRFIRFQQLERRAKFDVLGHKIRPSHQPKQPQIQIQDMDGSQLADAHVRALFELNDRAVRLYIPEPYHGQVTLFRCPLGHGRPEIRSPHPQLGWHKIAPQVDTHVIEAQGHMALVQEPAVAELGGQLQACLDKVAVQKGTI